MICNMESETQLLGFQADIMQNIEQGKQADAIIIDFSKAFDKVGHKRLAAKMEYYGVRGQINAWIRGFLADRSQTVVLQGSRSYQTEVKSGVPQGSVLGLCLFLFYINDLPDTLASNIRLFADDTVVYLAIGQQQDTTTLQDDLSKLKHWEQKWGMEFLPKKCQVLTFSRKHNTLKFDYNLHGHTLERVTEAKYLGVTFKQDLLFSINNMTPEANQTLGFLQCNVQVKPLLEYGRTVWDPHTEKEKQLEKMQRRSARYVMNRPKNRSSPTEKLQDLGWSSLRNGRDYRGLLCCIRLTMGLLLSMASAI